MRSTKFTEYCSNMSFHSCKSILLIQPSAAAEGAFSLLANSFEEPLEDDENLFMLQYDSR